MNKLPALPQKQKKLILRQKIQMSIDKKKEPKESVDIGGSMPIPSNLKQNTVQGKLSNHEKPASRPGITRRTAISQQKIDPMQKKTMPAKYFEIYRVKNSLNKQLDHFVHIFQLLPNIQQVKNKILALLSDAEIAGVQLIKQRKKITLTQKAYHSPSQQLQIYECFNMFILPSNSMNRQLLESMQNTQKHQKLKEQITTMTQTLLQKESILHKLESNIAKIKQSQEKTQQKLKISENNISIIEDKLQQSSHKESIEVFHQNEAISKMIKIAESWKHIKNKISQYRKAHHFSSNYFQLKSVQFIHQEILEELNQKFISNMSQSSKEKQQLSLRFGTFVQKIIHIYQSVINKLKNSNQEKEAYLNNMEMAIQTLFQAQKLKKEAIYKLKKQYLDLHSRIYIIYRRYQVAALKNFSFQIQKQLLSTMQMNKIIQFQRKNTHQNKRKSLQIKHHKNNRAKTVKFIQKQEKQNTNDPQSIHNQDKLGNIQIKTQDIDKLKKYSEMAQHIYLACAYIG